MNFNVGDYIKLKGSPNYYQIIKINGKKITKLNFVNKDLMPIKDLNGTVNYAESISGWGFEVFEMVKPAGDLPKHYRVILKIRELDQRFQERKLA